MTSTSLEDKKEAMDAVSKLLARVQSDGRNLLLTLANGIELRCKPVPPMYFDVLNENFRAPPPPKITVPAQDGRAAWEEENPNDPEYVTLLADLDRRNKLAVQGLVLGVGTEIVNVPDGMFRPEEEGWIDFVRRIEHFTGTTIPLKLDTPDDRYLSWMQFYAIDNNTDTVIANLMPQLLAGLREEDVDLMVGAFRRLQERRADPDSPAPDAGSNGDRSNRAGRRAGRAVRA